MTISNNQINNAAVPDYDGATLISVKHFKTAAISGNSFQNIKSAMWAVDTTFLEQSATISRSRIMPQAPDMTQSLLKFEGSSLSSLTLSND